MWTGGQDTIVDGSSRNTWNVVPHRKIEMVLTESEGRDTRISKLQRIGVNLRWLPHLIL